MRATFSTGRRGPLRWYRAALPQSRCVTVDEGLQCTSDNIPIVDMSLPPAELGRAVHRACSTIGFFHIVNHGISSDLRARVMDETKNFFALPQEDKEALTIANSKSYRGYQRVGINITNTKLDAHEALDLMSESERAKRHSSDGLTNFGQNQWPQRLPTLRPLLEHEYIPQMIRLGDRLLCSVARGFSLDPAFFKPYFSDPYWFVRLIHYPAAFSCDNYEFGVGEHTDYGVFTIILCDGTKGSLQIRPKGSPHWVTVEPIEDGFTCNIGDMLARWTNELYVSTPHRVLQPTVSSRYSVPFFFDPNYDSLIQPIQALVELSGRPSCFEPIMYGDHLLSRTSRNFVLENMNIDSSGFTDNCKQVNRR